MPKKIKRAKTQKLKGGAKLGEGGFGCLVKPAIGCKTRKYTLQDKVVSKIIHVRNKETYADELELYGITKQVDPQQHYFINIREECPLDIDKALTRQPKDFLKTRFTDEKRKGKEYDILEPAYKYLGENNVKDNFCKLDPEKDPHNIVMDYGGVDLYDIIRDEDSAGYKLCKKYIYHILKHICVAVKLLHSKKVVHRDIKPENLLYKPVKKKHKRTGKYIEYPLVRLIDLGLGEYIGKIEKFMLDDSLITHRGTPGFIPLEIDMLQKIYELTETYNIDEPTTKKLVIKEALDTYSDSGLDSAYYIVRLPPNIPPSKPTNDNTTKRYKYAQIRLDTDKLFEKFKMEFKSDTLHDKYFKQYDGYIYKTDIFALGLTIQKIAKRLNVFNDKIADLVDHMIEVNPDTRYNIVKCLKHPIFAKQH